MSSSHDEPAPARENCPEGSSSLAEFRAEILRLHLRFVAGDKQAGAEICKRLFRHLSERMETKYKWIKDEHLLTDAVGKALETYWRKPARFDAARACPLDDYLFLVCTRKLSDAVRSAARRAGHEIACPEEKIRAYTENRPGAAYLLTEEEKAAEARKTLDALAQDLESAIERTFIEMRLADIHHMEAYADVLIAADPSLADAPPEELKRLVKNAQQRAMDKLRCRAKKLED